MLFQNTYLLDIICHFIMSAKKNNISRKRSRPIEPKKSFLNLKVIGILIVIVIIIIFSGFYLLLGTDSENNNNGIEDGNPIAIIDTNMGIIQVELFKDKVPNTCNNFIDYVNDGFYDGLVFHRVIDDFMIQAGGFYPDGSNKETENPINLEISQEVRHVDGAIAMARTNDPNSATSQFYICDGAQSFLDDNYAAFGVVIEGIEIVRSIAKVDTTIKYNMQDWPVNDVIINSINIED